MNPVGRLDRAFNCLYFIFCEEPAAIDTLEGSIESFITELPAELLERVCQGLSLERVCLMVVSFTLYSFGLRQLSSGNRNARNRVLFYSKSESECV